jgi:hypothetical protein
VLACEGTMPLGRGCSASRRSGRISVPRGVYRGPRTVPPGRIAGSVGRCEDFDGDFLPTKASVGERWKRMDLAFHRGEELPPVSLHKVGGVYFVSDGDHRVSVARYHGVEWIDAVVTEFRAPSATSSPMEST